MRLTAAALPLILVLAACGQRADAPAADDAAATTAAADPAALETNGPPPPPDGAGDALVPGTDYNATMDLPCGVAGAAPTASCKAGVKRNWDGPGTAVVEVIKPDGTKRAIFFKGTTAFSADTSQADGSAAYDFAVARKGTLSTVKFGPETYVIDDVLIEGG